ncbi:hypothetical protein [Sphingomonas sanxanigenens]|uniref:Uncharacterized protein n=1 Tax=Sphingomonas sanxanigenens DSM 19645 = NX02 TaxID=1123269 RepID=W0A8L1_9SPHN|nr:hypothetical protein [Sphingomonas sanxanigenens]AHE53436.1 hypothetical protein NX02_08565 [Sphingomonas sanxanigenens DSM 19645 = NX02]
MDPATIATFRELLRQQDDGALHAMLAAGEARMRELDQLIHALIDEIARRQQPPPSPPHFPSSN